MSIGTGKRKTPLSLKQAKALRLMKDAMAAGEEFTPALAARCHDEAYECEGDNKLATTIAGQNMRRASFLAALSLDTTESQTTLKDVLWQWLLNWDTNADLAKTAAKLLSRSALAEKVHVTYDEGEFTGRTDEELQFFGANGRWPPKTIEGNLIQ